MMAKLLLCLILCSCAVETGPTQDSQERTVDPSVLTNDAGSPTKSPPCMPVFETDSTGQLEVKEWLCQNPATLDYKSDPERELIIRLPGESGPDATNVEKRGLTPR